MATRMIAHCETCSKSFQPAPKKSNKFCSLPCYRVAQRAGKYNTGPKDTTHRQPCRNCGKIVFGTKSSRRNGEPADHKYCNRNCYDAYRAQAIKDREGKRCAHCDKTIPGKIAETRGRKYCSMECRKIGMKAKPRKCKACSCLFTPIKQAHGKLMTNASGSTCSVDCHREWIRVNPERKRKISAAFQGDKHPNWQGGTHDSSGRGAGWAALAERIRKRAGYKCEHCGLTQEQHGRRLEVNHKVPFHQFGGKTKLANRPSNLEALCKSCHTKTDWKWRKENPVQIHLMPSRW